MVARFCDPVIGTGYGAETGADAVTTGSDIWQKEYALELQRRRLTLHDIELELQKEAKKKTPQIRFSPFEPATPFTLRFYSAAQNACWAVKLAHDGALSLNQCDERMP